MQRKINSLLFILLIISVNGFSQTVSSARAKGAGSTVTVKGIVTNGKEFGVIRYMQDASAGLAVYDTALHAVKAGDSIQLTGTLVNYSSLLELETITSFKVLNSGNTLPSPPSLSLSKAFTESYEGMLVTVAGVSFPTGGSFSAKTNFNITNGVQTEQIRIQDTSVNISGKSIPTSKGSITGIMSQYSPSSPSSGYQLLPRSTADLDFGTGPLIIGSLVQSNMTTTSFTLSFKTTYPGSTIIQYGTTKNLEIGTVSDTSKVKSHSVDLTTLSPATFYYARPISTDTNGKSDTGQIQFFSTVSLSKGWFNIWFDKSVDTSYSTGKNAVFLNKGMDDTLAAYLSKAKATLDIAIYSFDNSNLSVNLSNVINTVYSKGVKVRIIADGSNVNGALNLINSGIPIIKSPTSSKYGIMHDKFAIIDANSSDPNVPIVWTGSTNWTDNQFFTDANSSLAIQDQALAKAYTMEFNTMWGADSGAAVKSNEKFGPDKKDIVPHLFKIAGKYVELYFSPSDGTTQHAITTIDSAKHEILFSLNVLTRTDVATAIKNQVANNGIYAAGVVDTSEDGGPCYNIMKPALGSNLRVFKGSYIFHHKYFILDARHPNGNPKVIVGSHNWSTAAETKNDENILIIHNDTIANIYFQEWVKRYTDFGGVVTAVETDPTPVNVSSKISYRWYENTLSLGISSETNSREYIILTDMNGKKLYSGVASVTEGVNNVEINPGRIANGIYILNVYDAASSHSYKIIKY